MSEAIEQYLDRVMLYAHIAEPSQAACVRDEQADHLGEKIERFLAEGVPREDAVFRAIEAHGRPKVVGYGLRPRFPLIDIRTHGTARGVIAIGPRAVGVFAFGGAAFGVFAVGGMAAGVVSFGGLAAALLFTWAGVGVASFAYAGVAVGLVAAGGMAVGVVSAGGYAFGMWVPDGGIGLSYFNADGVPHWLRALDPFLTNGHLYLSVTTGLVLSYIPLLGLPQWLLFKERRRLREAGF